MTSQEAARLVNYAFLVFPPMVALLMVANVWYLKRVREILAYLAQNHAAVWEALGKPTLFKNNSPANSRRIVRFIFQREFVPLGDGTLTAKCETVRKMLVTLLTVEAAFAILFLILFVLGSIFKS